MAKMETTVLSWAGEVDLRDFVKKPTMCPWVNLGLPFFGAGGILDPYDFNFKWNGILMIMGMISMA